MLSGILLDLVPWDERFEARMVDWLNGPMREWWGMDGLLTRASRQRHEEANRDRPGHGARFVRFGMQAKDGTPIGTFVLAHIHAAHRTAEVGAGIGNPAYWSGGFGSDAMLLLVEYAFGWADLRRLWLSTMGHNYRAQRQIEKCGFSREAAARSAIFVGHQQTVDFLYYGLLREEWPGYAAMVDRLGLHDKAVAHASRMNGDTDRADAHHDRSLS